MIYLHLLAVLFSLAGFYPYILAIIKGHTKPHLFSWGIWSVVGIILLVSYYYSINASYLSLLVPFAYTIGPIVIFFLALKYGEFHYTLFDIACLSAAFLSLILWAVMKDPLIVLLFNLLIDLFGAIPTLYKTFLDPDSEDSIAWSLFLTGSTINLIPLPFGIELIYPFYLFLISFMIIFIKMISFLKKNYS